MSQQIDLAKVGVRTSAVAAGQWVGADFAASRYPRAEVEAAYRDYVDRANAHDWDRWCDIFTEDVLYVDHHFGVFRGREEVRKWMVPLMAGPPEVVVPPGWVAIVRGPRLQYTPKPSPKTPRPRAAVNSSPQAAAA